MSALGEPVAAISRSHFQWPAIFGGAASQPARLSRCNAFAAGIGLSIISGAPTWRDSSVVTWLLAGVFLLFVAIVSFAVGGYVSGRMRAPLNIGSAETEFRDGMHGLVTWGLAVVVTALLALGAAAASAVAPTGWQCRRGPAGGGRNHHRLRA